VKKCNCIKQMIFYMLLIYCISSLMAYAQEGALLKPNIDVDALEVDPLADYYGLELKWSVEKGMNSNVTTKVTYMDPEVYLALVYFDAMMQGSTEEETQAKVDEALNLLEQYLIFRVFTKHDDDPDLTSMSNWEINLIDDKKDEYSPVKIEEGEAELRKAHAGPYYGRESFVYFSRYRSSGKKLVLNEETRWVRVKLFNSAEDTTFEWVFSEEALKVEKNPSAFHPYFRVMLVVVLLSVIILIWITRPRRVKENSEG
jgi:hypothetical protein